MNLISTTLSLQMALLAIALAAPGPVQSAETATVSQHDLQAKLVYCKTCHPVPPVMVRTLKVVQTALAWQVNCVPTPSKH